MQRAHVLISGKVQGVWFRKYTQKKSNLFGLSGWVRNLPDGRVEAVFEGPEDKIHSIIDWCHKGSPLSSVEKVEVKLEMPLHEKGFRIR